MMPHSYLLPHSYHYTALIIPINYPDHTNILPHSYHYTAPILLICCPTHTSILHPVPTYCPTVLVLGRKYIELRIVLEHCFNRTNIWPEVCNIMPHWYNGPSTTRALYKTIHCPNGSHSLNTLPQW